MQLCIKGIYSNISDDKPDDLVKDAQRDHPGMGLKMPMSQVCG